MGMPAFDDNLKSLREHLVNRRKNLQMGGMPVAGRRIHIAFDMLLTCFAWNGSLVLEHQVLLSPLLQALPRQLAGVMELIVEEMKKSEEISVPSMNRCQSCRKLHKEVESRRIFAAERKMQVWNDWTVTCNDFAFR